MRVRVPLPTQVFVRSPVDVTPTCDTFSMGTNEPTGEIPLPDWDDEEAVKEFLDRTTVMVHRGTLNPLRRPKWLIRLFHRL